MADSPTNRPALHQTVKRCVECNETKKIASDFLEPSQDVCIRCAAFGYFGGDYKSEMNRGKAKAAAEAVAAERDGVRKMIEQLVGAAGESEKKSLPHVCELGEAIYSVAKEKYGRDGKIHVAWELWNAMDEAKAANPGSVAHQRFFTLLLNLSELGTEYAATAKTSDHFTPEESLKVMLEMLEPAMTDDWLLSIAKKRPHLKIYTEPDAAAS